MESLRDVLSKVKRFYEGINGANLSGAIDVVVVRQPDGTLRCSPFHVRFGKFSLLQPAERVVHIRINGRKISDIRMKVGGGGEAFFVTEASPNSEVPDFLVTSPIPASRNLTPEPAASASASASASQETFAFSSRPSSDADASLDTSVNSSNASVASDLDNDATDTEKDDFSQWEWGKLPQHEGGEGAAEEDLSETEEKSGDGILSRLGGFFKRQPADEEQSNSSKADSDDIYLRDITPEREGDYEFTDNISFHSTHEEFPPLDEEGSSDSNDDRRGSMTPPGRSRSLPRSYSDSSEYPALSRSLPNSFMRPTYSLASTRGTHHALGAQVEISRCGPLCRRVPADFGTKFEEHAIPYDQFIAHPSILSDPNIVFRIDGLYYNWEVAAPIIMSMVLFNRPLPAPQIDSLIEKHVPKSNDRSWWFWRRAESRGRLVEHRERHTYKKVLRLTSEQLQKLDLQEGLNIAEFSVVSKYQGRATVQCGIYLWNYDDTIVLSDIDGTITKSDVIGHAAAFVGRDWTHVGIASFYSAIASNGYKFLYLSSRSISHSSQTKGFLKSISQATHRLPDGPVLLSPDNLLTSLRREVYHRLPQQFKIACLMTIKDLFPSDPGFPCPFSAGFGNRSSDELTYQTVGIPAARIFTINSYGDIKIPKSIFKSSYNQLNDIVDQLFPSLQNKESDAFGSFSYWRSPLPSLSDTDLALLSPSSPPKK
eukprot:m.75725 g.75725  ORF g.75725 m.75725 type:complete len:710 (-) comp8092_c0_seq4:231-2360(-)